MVVERGSDEIYVWGDGVVGREFCFMAERRWSVLEFEEVEGPWSTNIVV